MWEAWLDFMYCVENEDSHCSQTEGANGSLCHWVLWFTWDPTCTSFEKSVFLEDIVGFGFPIFVNEVLIADLLYHPRRYHSVCSQSLVWGKEHLFPRKYWIITSMKCQNMFQLKLNLILKNTPSLSSGFPAYMHIIYLQLFDK